MIWHLETFNFRRRRRRRGQAQNVSEWTITTKMASYSVPFRLWIIVNNLTITIRMTWNSINKLFRQGSIYSVNVVVLFYSTKKMELFINSHHKNRARRRWSPLPKPFLDSSVVCVCKNFLCLAWNNKNCLLVCYLLCYGRNLFIMNHLIFFCRFDFRLRNSVNTRPIAGEKTAHAEKKTNEWSHQKIVQICSIRWSILMLESCHRYW